MNTVIYTPAQQGNRSEIYFSTLGFTRLNHENLTCFTDGKCTIELSADKYARPGIKLFNTPLKGLLSKGVEVGNAYPFTGGMLIRDFNGVWIYLMDEESGISKDLETVKPSLLGNFAGVSVESTDLARSQRFWEALGFSLQAGAPDKGFIVLVNDEGIGMSFMKPLSCPHSFITPSLTYFNGKENLTVIENIRASGIPIEEEVTVFNEQGIVDNIILREPGGYGFFVFND